MPKRRRQEAAQVLDNEDSGATPRKTRRSAQKPTGDDIADATALAETPRRRKSILRGTPSKLNGGIEHAPTSTPLKKVVFSTPAKGHGKDADGETPVAIRNDRSARRKSARTLQKQQESDDVSDVEDDVQDERVARLVLDEEDAEDDEHPMEQELDGAVSTLDLDTPSKSDKPRGRSKGKRRERTPSPPPNLPPHEQYFFQNRVGGNKTSANTLPSHLLLSSEDYRTQTDTQKDHHAADIKALSQLHKRAFDQWIFELEQGFNICLYGYGSKRSLIMEFAEHLYCQAERAPKIIVVNGYTPGLTLRDILTTLAGQLLPKNTKLPAQPASLLEVVMSALSESQSASRIHLIIHSLDHSNLRKPATQSIIARLAAHPSISLVTSCDTPNFALLWDLTLTRRLKFLYHDATTFEPYKVEIDVVEEVNALLDRSGRRLGGRDGVGYVLKSLPENARNLFRILVAEQLTAADTMLEAFPEAQGENMDPDDILGVSDEEDAAMQQDTPSRRGRGRPARKPKAPRLSKQAVAVAEGVEYRTLYHKAVEGFVCSSELNFRTLLKEFHDHQMIESRKDGLGTERLAVPFRREEMETMLEELV